MELGWMVDSRESDTGRFVATAKEVLHPEFSIVILTPERGTDEVFHFPVVLYSLSNSEASLPVWLTLMKRPGIAVLHDSTYCRLFAHYYLDYLRSPYLYWQTLRILYGEEISVKTRQSIREGKLFKHIEEQAHSIVELITKESLGLMVVSRELWKNLRKRGSRLCALLPSPENPDSFRRCFIAIIKGWALRIEQICIAFNLLIDVASNVSSMDTEVSKIILHNLSATFREVL